jgi:hypothetical protein
MVAKLILIAVWMGLSLAACATAPLYAGIPCSIGPILLDSGASKRLTRDEKEQIVVLNESGEKFCGWAAP